MKNRTLKRVLITSGIILFAVPIHSNSSKPKNLLENGSLFCGDVIGSCISGPGG